MTTFKIIGPFFVPVYSLRTTMSQKLSLFPYLETTHFSPIIIRVIKSRKLRWAGCVACVRERRGAFRVMVEKPDGRRPLGRFMRGLEDNIKMDFREVFWGHGLN